MKKYYQSFCIIAFVFGLSQNLQAQCVPNTKASTATGSQNVNVPTSGNTVNYRDVNANLGTYATYLLQSYYDTYSTGTVEYTFSSTYCTSVGGCNPNDNNYHTYIIITDTANNIIKQGDAPLKVLSYELAAVYKDLSKPAKFRAHFRTTDNNCIIYTGSSAGNYYRLYLTANACLAGVSAYRDADGDGYGSDPIIPVCPTVPPGYVLIGGDCDDTDPAYNIIESKWFFDNDQDGFGDINSFTIECKRNPGLVKDSTDCNDNDSTVNPNKVWYKDIDGDGFGDKNNIVRGCIQPTGTVADSTDCNDASANDTQVFSWYPDADGDGYGKSGVTPAFTSCKNPNFRLEGVTLVSNNTDCNDNDPNINLNAIEVLNNNVDENCDGGININNSLNFLDYPSKNTVTIPYNTSLDLDTNFTIEAWIKTSVENDATILMKSGDEYDYSFGLSGGLLLFYSSNISDVYSSIPVNDNMWNHVAVSVGNKKVTFYVNGVAEEHPATLVATKSTSDLMIGNAFGNILSGNIDELRIWNTTRTALQIKNTMSKSLTGSNKTGLVAYYTFDQGNPGKNNTTITQLDDVSGNGNHGTLKNFILNGNASNFVGGAPSFYIAPTIITDVQNEGLASSVKIYPNPNNGTFNISSTSELGNVTVFNSLGFVVYQTNVSAKQLNIELPSKEAGIYFVKVGNRMTKLIKE
jgi:hypothetical protein